jgi:hypothetical protein
MGVSPPHPGSISLSIFSGLHCGARSMRHPEGGDKCLKVSEGSRGCLKIHKGLQRALKVSKVLQRSLEPQNNVWSCRGCSWNIVGLWDVVGSLGVHIGVCRVVPLHRPCTQYSTWHDSPNY